MAAPSSIINITNLANLQWDKSNLWSINIKGMPDFHAWPGGTFAANDTQLGFFGISNESIGSTGLDIPHTRTVPSLTLSYVDDETLTITNFFKDWLREMITLDGFRVQTLEEALKIITIYKLKHDLSIAETWILKAFPTGNFDYHGDSDGGQAPIYSLTFTVVAGNLESPN